ncbi:putative ribonuclease H-like domain-containing protein [Tanacetum coccineum]
MIEQGVCEAEQVHFGQDGLVDFDWSNTADDTPVSLALMATTQRYLTIPNVVRFGVESSSGMESENSSGNTNSTESLYPNFQKTKGFHSVPPPTGCSGSMTGDKDKLSDFKEFKGGYVAFGNDSKRGRISGKGTIKTSCLDFEKVSYVEELKFNLLSVSQICDKKHNVLFTDKECLILSPKFKFVDEDLDSLSMAQKIGHVNIKILTSWLKAIWLRFTFQEYSKLDHLLSCRKGKQHRASCKKIEERTVREPLELLHMDLFGPVSVESVNRKKYCLVVTDDCSKFSWVFFLAYKDETYDMLHDLIVGMLLKRKRGKYTEKGKEVSFASTFTLSTLTHLLQSTGNTTKDSDDDVPKDGVFSTNSFDDENTDTEEGGAADYNNMDPTINVTSTPTLRIHKNHPQRGVNNLDIRLSSWQCKKQTIVAIHYRGQNKVAAASVVLIFDIISIRDCYELRLINVVQASLRVINEVPHIRAMVAGKRVLISEETIRADLLFDDADGVDCFPKQVIWDSLRDIGYEGTGKFLQGMLKFPLIKVPLLSQASISQGLLKYKVLQKYKELLKYKDYGSTRYCDFQSRLKLRVLLLISKSPMINTPTMRLQTSGGDEGLLDLYALNREVRRLKKQTLSQAKQIRKLKAKLKKLSKVTLKRKSDETEALERKSDETEALERKSDETEHVNIEEEKDASNVKSGDTEELDLERISKKGKSDVTREDAKRLLRKRKVTHVTAESPSKKFLN